VNRGQVALPEAAAWLKAFSEELQNFPLSAQKDQVDSFVHALSYAARPSEFKPREFTSYGVMDYDAEVGSALSEFFDNDPSSELISPATQRALDRWRSNE
jgi:hypothetical protein